MIDKLLRLTWRKLLLVAVAWGACVVLHNVFYGLLRGYFGPNWDEPFFFLLAIVVIPAYLVVAAIYTSVALIATWRRCMAGPRARSRNR